MASEPPAPGRASRAGAGRAPAAAAAPAGRDDAASPGHAPGRPALSVVRGEPTDVEVAAVIAVLAARSRAAAALAAEPPAPVRSAWAARSRLLRETITPGPGAWKRSALPR